MGGNSQLPSRLSSTGSHVVTFSHLVAEVSDTIDRFAASHQPLTASSTTSSTTTASTGEPTNANNNSNSNSGASNGYHGHPHSALTNGLLKSPASSLLHHPTDLSITSRSTSDNNTSTVGDFDMSQRSANPSRGVSNASAMLPAALSTSELNTFDLDALDGDALFSFLLNTN